MNQYYLFEDGMIPASITMTPAIALNVDIIDFTDDKDEKNYAQRLEISCKVQGDVYASQHKFPLAKKVDLKKLEDFVKKVLYVFVHEQQPTLDMSRIGKVYEYDSLDTHQKLAMLFSDYLRFKKWEEELKEEELKNES